MPFLFRPHSADAEYLRACCTDRPPGRTHESQYTRQHLTRSVNCKTLMIWQCAPRLSNMFSVFAETPETSGDSPLAGEKEVVPSCPSSQTPTLLSLEAAPQVPWREPLRRQVQHHGKGSSRGRREKGKEKPRALPQPLTGVCCDWSPERLVDPCLELNLFHDSANLPRLALRLRLRLSALSSRSEQPLSSSAASLHFFPMLSSPAGPDNTPAPGALARSSRRRVSLQPARSSLLAPPLPPPAPARTLRSVTAVATRLRLRPRLAQPWAGAVSATCAGACFLLRSKLLFTPQPQPSLGGARPTPGVTDSLLVATSSLPTTTRSLGLGTNLTPLRAAGASLVTHSRWVETPVDLEKDRKHATLSFLFSFLSPLCSNNRLLSILGESRASSPWKTPR